MTQNGGQNFDSSSRALGAFDQRGPYGILIHLGVDFLKMNESQFRAENPAAKYPLPYSQQLLIHNGSEIKPAYFEPSKTQKLICMCVI